MSEYQLGVTQKLPPGWDCKYDPKTGLYFYINYFTKKTTFDDPRMKYNPSINTSTNSTENIPMQTMHASPYHVYPVNDLPTVQAFQEPCSISATTSKLQQMEMVTPNVTRPSTPRTQASRNNIHETTFTTPMDTEMSVQKINTMFPTVSETHIRMLLKKYLKSIYPGAEETLILDVLSGNENNVQKASEHLVVCGYEKRDTTKPKTSMRKKDEALNEVKSQNEKAAQLKATPPPKKPETEEEKAHLKVKLQAKYESIAERIISMALESVDYCEEKAVQILNIVVAENEPTEKNATSENSPVGDLSLIKDEHSPGLSTATAAIPKRQSCNALKKMADLTPTDCVDFRSLVGLMTASAAQPLNRQKPTKLDQHKYKGEVVELQQQQQQQQLPSEQQGVCNKMTRAMGTNKSLAKGPNDEILLIDYMVWNGANPNFVRGATAADPERRKYVPKGANSDLCNGPKQGLAKGSAYAKGAASNMLLCT